MLVGAAFEGSNAVELLVVHAVETDPFLSPLANHIAQFRRIMVETDGVRVQGLDLDSASEVLQQNLCEHLGHTDTLGDRAVYEIHTQTVELVGSLSVDHCGDDRLELEETRSAGYGTVSDDY